MKHEEKMICPKDMEIRSFEMKLRRSQTIETVTYSDTTTHQIGKKNNI